MFKYLLLIAVASLGAQSSEPDRTARSAKADRGPRPIPEGIERAEGDTDTYYLETYFPEYTLIMVMSPKEDSDEMTVETVLRRDDITGEITLWDWTLSSDDDEAAGSIAATQGGLDCSPNGCYGVCCAIELPKKICMLCTCCDQGGHSCQLSAWFCVDKPV